MQSALEEIGYFIGLPKGAQSSQEYAAAVQNSVRTVLKTYGSNATEGDRQAAERSFGAGLNPAAARTQLALVAKSKIWEVEAHNADIDDRANNAGMTEANRQAILAQKVTYPPADEELLKIMNIPRGQVDVLRQFAGTPQEAEARREFDRANGKNLSKWILGK